MASERSGMLLVHLICAKDLKEVEWFGTQDPYAVLTCGRSNCLSRVHKDGGKNPKWDQQFNFNNVSTQSSLEIQLFDKNKRCKDGLIGTSKADLQTVCEGEVPQEMALPVFRGIGKQHGTLYIRVHFNHGYSRPPPALEWMPPDWIVGETERVEEHYILGRVLGKGTFGTTRLATSKHTKEEYACKTVSKRKLKSQMEVDDMRREIQIMHHLAGHKNVVKLKKVYESQSNVHIVMELCTGGELFENICKQKHYSEKDAASIIRTIVSVVAHCHQMGVMHRDLKPENFLLGDDSPTATLKATDFGLGVFFQEGQVLNDVVGSPFYIAPEVLRRKYGKEADIWSCGVILYILLCGVPPFAGKAEKEIFERILHGTVDMTHHPWPKISDAAKDCVRRMLVKDPQLRASATQILEHPWMRENGVADDCELELEVVKRIKNFAFGNKMKKEALRVIAKNLPAEEVAGLQVLFREFDTDGDGTITVDEFREGLKIKGTTLREWDLQLLMEDADVNGDGEIDYEEFLAAAMNSPKLERQEHLMKAFEHFDKDQSGFISKDELLQVMTHLGVTDVDDILAEVDRDGNGSIDYQEFKAMMQSQQIAVA